jgi:hypothetical protein
MNGETCICLCIQSAVLDYQLTLATSIHEQDWSQLRATQPPEEIVGKPARDVLEIHPLLDILECKASFAVNEISLLNIYSQNRCLELRPVLCLSKVLPICTFLLDTNSCVANPPPAEDDNKPCPVVLSRFQRVDPYFSLSIEVNLL